jgi:hypothetical protein
VTFLAELGEPARRRARSSRGLLSKGSLVAGEGCSGPQRRGSKRRRLGCGRRHRRRPVDPVRAGQVAGTAVTISGQDLGPDRLGCLAARRVVRRPAWAQGRTSALCTGRRPTRRLTVASRKGASASPIVSEARRAGDRRLGARWVQAPERTLPRSGCLQLAPVGRTLRMDPRHPSTSRRSVSRAAFARDGSRAIRDSRVAQPGSSGWASLWEVAAVGQQTRTRTQWAARPLPQSRPGGPPTRPIPLSSGPVGAGACLEDRSSPENSRKTVSRAIAPARQSCCSIPAALVEARSPRHDCLSG